MQPIFFFFQILVESVWVDIHHKRVFALQWHAGYPVDESRSSQADGGTESVHVTGRI